MVLKTKYSTEAKYKGESQGKKRQSLKQYCCCHQEIKKHAKRK